MKKFIITLTIITLASVAMAFTDVMQAPKYPVVSPQLTQYSRIASNGTVINTTAFDSGTSRKSKLSLMRDASLESGVAIVVGGDDLDTEFDKVLQTVFLNGVMMVDICCG